MTIAEFVKALLKSDPASKGLVKGEAEKKVVSGMRHLESAVMLEL